MIVRETQSKTILSKSEVYPYTINPYVGCQHQCTYCYARFMRRFSGHREPWGEFVDVKINAPDLLRNTIKRKKPGRVWISGVCDPYQPLEVKYALTQRCLEILVENSWPVVIQTRSPLVLRDMDIIKKGEDMEVGLTITTADDRIRSLFEPKAPPIEERISTLGELHRAGIRTYVMIAPMLPGVEGIAEQLAGKVDHVILDRMNYHHADWVYRKYGLQDKMADSFFIQTERILRTKFMKLGISFR